MSISISLALVSINGQKVWATPAIAETLSTLEAARKGGFAKVYGYKSVTNMIEPSVSNITFISRFSYEKLLEKKLKALSGIDSNTVKNIVSQYSHSSIPENFDEIFQERLNMIVESAKKTLSGDRSDAHRAAHDRCYIHVANGVKVHLQTEKKNGIMEPVLHNGYPIVDSIMVSALQVAREYIEHGKRKETNKRFPTIVGEAIERAAGVKGMITLSLRDDNFHRVVIDNNVILPEDIKEVVI